ncbi:FAD-binding monooxygenase [Streptomyces sp. NPDC051567]|uniref:FAD-binding monooxygenase n=1 Tax=Streptomyces sp. NPDC051567 TaxID=3365660 RepID=UPI0037A576CB
MDERLREGRRAIVIGAGISGLLSAAALAPAFQEVLVLEQDPRVPAQNPGPRPGVPQGRHPNILMMRGAQAMRDLLPGLDAALVRAGVRSHDTGHVVFCAGERTSPPRSFGLPAHSVSRPVLEECIRAEVSALPQVRMENGVRVVGLHTTTGRRVAGVAVAALPGGDGTRHQGEPEVLHADLVLDASGRTSQAHHWLRNLGVPAPRTEIVDGQAGYVTTWLTSPGPLTPARPMLYELGSISRIGRGAAAVRVEGGLTVLAAFGRGEDRPPADRAGFLAFLRSLDNPLLDGVAAGLGPGEPLYRYARLPNRRRRYAMRSWPAGLLVLGDALCLLNPVYGQGMTVAALQAVLLRRHGPGLRHDPGNVRQVQRLLTRQTTVPWLTSTAQDARWTSTPPFYTTAIAWLLDRTLDRAIDDEHAHRAILETMHMVSRTALLRPRTLAALLRPEKSGRA